MDEFKKALLMNIDEQILGANINVPIYGELFDSNNEEFNYCVYAHICNVSGSDFGKTYIGVSKNVEARWYGNGSGYKDCTELAKGFNEYGWDNFYHIILISNVTASMASIIEKELIKKFDTNYKTGGFGYNSCGGGIGVYHPIMAEDYYLYISDKNDIYLYSCSSFKELSKIIGCDITDFNMSCDNGSYGDLNWKKIFYQREKNNNKLYSGLRIVEVDIKGNIISTHKDIYSISSKQKERNNIINACKAIENNLIYHDKLWFFEYECTQINIKNRVARLNKKHLGRSDSAIISYDLEGNQLNKYSSPEEASNLTGLRRKSIVKACFGWVKTYGGMQWRYERQDPPGRLHRRFHQIVMLDTNYNEIKRFDTMGEALCYFGKDKDNTQPISNVCKGKKSSYRGYIWRFLDDEGNIINPEEL